MKTTGIVILVIGCISTLGGLIQTIALNRPNFAGVGFIVLGAYLISRANKRKEADMKKKQWKDGEA